MINTHTQQHSRIKALFVMAGTWQFEKGQTNN